MATRRLIRDVIHIPEGCIDTPLSRVKIMTTHLKRARWCNVVFDDHPATLHFHTTAYTYHQQPLPGTLVINEMAMALADDPRTVFPSRRKLWKNDAGREVIVGPALLTLKISNMASQRYVRVATISNYGWTPKEFSDWADMNFENDAYPVGFVGDFKSTYVECEDPDPVARDIKLTMARLRFG
jgi:hypothetical protein